MASVMHAISRMLRMTTRVPLRTLLAVAAATILALAACSPTVSPASTPDQTSDATATATATATRTATEGETASPSPTSTPEPAFDDPQECENDELGFEVEYPGDWWANEDIEGEAEGVQDIEECTYFARQEVEIAPATQIPVEVAIWFDSPAADAPESQGEVISRDETTVDGNDAVVIEYEPPVGGFAPEGTVIYTYRITTDDGLLAARTNAFGHEDDYEDNKDVLDSMMETLEIDD